MEKRMKLLKNIILSWKNGMLFLFLMVLLADIFLNLSLKDQPINITEKTKLEIHSITPIISDFYKDENKINISQQITDSQESEETITLEDIEITSKQEVMGEKIDSEPGAKVIKVIDGDTIEVEGGIVVRYIGIDTPETVHPQKEIQCFGTEASSVNRELVLDKTVRLEKDISETDKYGRLLRYVWLDEVMVNEYLVREGYAKNSTYPPDVKYQQLFITAERQAREEKNGLWGSCSYPISPTVTASSSDDPKNNCQIKGNISTDSHIKIYHLPDCSGYSKTQIDENKGEKWFCSEEEAVDAGWRKAENCP
ncbi:hypothetical protein A2Y99_04300 [Candidatus Gottesmanbacteria bacterium RBG_13_37_7]|uniref:TNase-like domain-containing protein n=1 Tax=Candidatus Gottesmanbacteria bacterium RBG_13_37_7 TaxID=1798369 RepID=A0A1F5YHB2_9BACT|nr:MAG: hypothetical protein A2Y99_04300 [Candidatus Gottesmanbacteria bacterium RBG_13_37_7]